MPEETEYTGTIALFAGPYAPANWKFCDGEILSIANYTQLFSLLGDRFGGDGRRTFGLPDLRGRAVWGEGEYLFPQTPGSEEVTLIDANLPNHTHNVRCVTEIEGSEIKQTPENNCFSISKEPSQKCYSIKPKSDMNKEMLSSTGETDPHPHKNMQPFQVLNYIICVAGDYPPRAESQTG